MNLQERAIESGKIVTCNSGKYKAGKMQHTGLYALYAKKQGHDYVQTFTTLKDLIHAMDEILVVEMWIIGS